MCSTALLGTMILLGIREGIQVNAMCLAIELQVDLLEKRLSWTMTFEPEGLLNIAIYIWLPPASYVVFLTTLVLVLTALNSLF